MKFDRKGSLIIGILCFTATAGYIARVNVSTAGPLIMQEFGISQVTMGKIFSIFLLGYALFQIPSGVFADRWGAKKVLAAAAFLWVFFTILQSLAGWGPFGKSATGVLGAFMLIRFFFGLSQSPTYPASARGVSVWINPSFQGRANGIIIASIGIGSAIAPPLVSAVMLNWGWRAAMLVSVVPALLAALLLLRLKEPANINAPAGSHSSDSSPDLRGKGSLKSPAFILLTISYTLQGYVGYIFVTWFYIYLVQERKFSLLGGAWMSSLPWILSIISIPLGGFLSDRLVKSNAGEKWGRRVIPITGMVLSGIMISIGAHTLNPVTAAITLALATALILCVEGPFWTTMISVSGGRSGTAGGIMNTGSNIGGLISPVITPFIASVTGWENALHIAALLAVAGGLLWFWIKPEDRI